MSTPSAPVEVGYHSTAARPEDVVAVDGWVYIAEGGSGFEIFQGCGLSTVPVELAGSFE